jgi:hypothetical protein
MDVLVFLGQKLKKTYVKLDFRGLGKETWQPGLNLSLKATSLRIQASRLLLNGKAMFY